jgi:ribosomal protein S18 acetylase RimI-like enzyme
MRIIPSVRAFQPDEWPLYRELRLEALRDAPDAFGSTLARERAFPEQEWKARLAAAAKSGRDLPLVAEVSGRAVGLVWVRIDEKDASTATLFQLWVHPAFRRAGVGRALLEAATAWARGAGATTMSLCVATGAQSAIQFYRRLGFVESGEPSPLRPQSSLSQQPMRLPM